MENQLNILVIGSGGREHALVNKCLESSICKKVIAAPGNGGIAQSADCFPTPVDDIPAIVALAKSQSINFVIVGPEVPLCLGLVDALAKENILAYGPKKDGAELESSKTFCKNFFKKHKIPTAEYETFTHVESALNYLKDHPVPIVIKASGLAAGKGVIIAQTNQEAEEAVRSMIVDKTFGDSGSEIVIEECLVGEEVSIHAIVSGETFLCLSPSQDHKRIGEGDTGLNTGGMGAYAPTSALSKDVQEVVEKTIILPTIHGLIADGIQYNGTLYAGLMLTDSGPKILEYNVRFGDPETQVLLPLIEDDFVKLLYTSAQNRPLPANINLSTDKCMTVVIASRGYPGSYSKGEAINMPDELPDNTDIIHAGTLLDSSNQILSNGGRVLSVTSRGNSIKETAKTIYSVCDSIDYKSKVFRRDIAHREINR